MRPNRFGGVDPATLFLGTPAHGPGKTNTDKQAKQAPMRARDRGDGLGRRARRYARVRRHCPVAAVVPHNNASTIECTHRRLCIVPRPRSTSVSFLLPSPPARVVVCVRPTNSGDTPEPSPPLSSDMGHEGGKWWSKGNERRTENTNERQWGPAHASRESPSQ